MGYYFNIQIYKYIQNNIKRLIVNYYKGCLVLVLVKFEIVLSFSYQKIMVLSALNVPLVNSSNEDHKVYICTKFGRHGFFSFGTLCFQFPFRTMD